MDFIVVLPPHSDTKGMRICALYSLIGFLFMGCASEPMVPENYDSTDYINDSFHVDSGMTTDKDSEAQSRNFFLQCSSASNGNYYSKTSYFCNQY